MAGLRERKRSQTAEGIRAAALGLFASKGYADTTVDDIATAAEVSRATVFRYYPSKEDMLFASDEADGAELLARARPRAEAGAPFADAVCSSLIDFAGYMDDHCDRLWLRWDIVSREDRLLGRAILTYARWADDLVGAIGDRDDFRHDVVAASAMGALYASVRRCHRTHEGLVGLVTAALDQLDLDRAR